MADEIVYKKMTRKADKGLEGKVVAKHGKQTNQKLKPYVVLEYLLKYSDENNTKSAYDIIGYLEGCGISAERRKGDRYTISPFQLFINDGNYYLLAFDDRYQEMRTYRVDRMKDISRMLLPLSVSKKAVSPLVTLLR